VDRHAFWVGLLTIFSVLCWLVGIVLFGFLQLPSACWMFIGAGLCLAYPVKIALTAYEDEHE
jgi:hypothetical protein